MSQEKSFKPEIKMAVTDSKEKNEEKNRENIEVREFTPEQDGNQLKVHEEDFLQGLIDAAGYAEEEKQRIEIAREGRLMFAFSIRPLSESEYNSCKKKHTKFVRNRSLGVKMPEDTDNVKYRADLIYRATIEEDKKKLWDNKKVWEALRNKGMQIRSEERRVGKECGS